MKKSKKILSLNKLTISKLNNSISIVGGNDNEGEVGTTTETVGTIRISIYPFLCEDKTNPEMCL